MNLGSNFSWFMWLLGTFIIFQKATESSQGKWNSSKGLSIGFRFYPPFYDIKYHKKAQSPGDLFLCSSFAYLAIQTPLHLWTYNFEASMYRRSSHCADLVAYLKKPWYTNSCVAHWSKWTLIPFLIWRTFDHSRRWEMIKEF